MVSKLFTSAFINLLIKLALIIILVLALFLRLYKINQTVWLQSGYDESRDMLVAKHIAIHGEHIIRGPLAAGGMSWLANSPIYYYFISFIWFFAKEPKIFMYFWAIMLTTPVFIAYFIGKKIKDPLTGLIFASILAINYQMIYSSRELLQAHLSLIFSMSFIWSFVSYLKNQENTKYLLYTIFFLLFPLHFHYGVLLILPSSLLLIIYYVYKNFCQNRKKYFTKILIPLISFLTILWSWIILTYQNFPLDQIYFFNKNFTHQYNLTLWEQLQKTLLTLNQMIWGSEQTTWLSIFFLGLIVFLTKKMIGNEKMRKIFIFLIVIILSLLLVVFYKNRVTETYLLFIFPFFLILLALSIKWIIESNIILGGLLFVLSFVLMLNNSLINLHYYIPSVSFHDQQKNLAQVIYDDYLNQKITNNQTRPSLLISWYTTTGNMPFDGWGSSGIWFYLENYFKQKLVKNTSYGLNHIPINQYPQLIYMVCDHRLNSDLIQEECLRRFERSYLIDTNSVVKIKSGDNLSLWRAKLKNGQTQATVNVVHQDLLNL